MKNNVLRTVSFWTAAVLAFGLYVFASLAALGNLLGIKTIASSLDVALTTGGFSLLTFLIVLPLLIFAIVIFMGHKKSRSKKLLLLLAGLSIVAIAQLNATHFISFTSLIG